MTVPRLSEAILIVDGSRETRWALSAPLQHEGYRVFQAEDGPTALKILADNSIQLAVIEADLADTNGLHLLGAMRRTTPQLPILMTARRATVDAAVAAFKGGAIDFLTRPVQPDQLLAAVRQALRQHPAHPASLPARMPLREAMGPSRIIGQLIREVERVAPTEFTTIIHGETGSGKELIAQTIHDCSARASGPFVPVDCGALQPSLIESELFGHDKGSYTGADRARPGKFSLADGGTLFLDEVQNLPLATQTKFLRALQEKQICPVGGSRYVPVSVRVIAACNEDLMNLVAQGRFRADLYYRLSEFTIRVPALRERPEDLPHLAGRFFDLTCRELGKQLEGISPAALEVLQAHSWPGNVRELRNVVRRAVLVADTCVEPEHLGLKEAGVARVDGLGAGELGEPAGLGQLSFKELVRQSVIQAERNILLQVLRQTGGNKAKAARLLQIDYKTMRTKARMLGIRLGSVAEVLVEQA